MDFILPTCPRIVIIIALICSWILPSNINAQVSNETKMNYVVGKTSSGKADINQTRERFIKNEGQYGDTLAGFGFMGKILFGYEGFDMPVLFTEKGIIHLQRSITRPSEREKEEMEKMGLKEEVIENKLNIQDRTITMQWLQAKENVVISMGKQAPGYHTYGMLQAQVPAYESLTYKNLYEGIDLVLFFDKNEKVGFRYQLEIHPGADLSKLQFQFGGDVNHLYTNFYGDLIIQSDINGIHESAPISYYASDDNFTPTNKIIKSKYVLNDNILQFEFPRGLDSTQAFVIDPFISATSNLTGGNASKAKDVDFDYAGNVYVTGGGDGSVYKLAKFDSSGTLKWTFSGTLTVPSWSFGTYYGGWVVDKTTGDTYLGQGFAPGGGFRIIRLNTSGAYDSYITTANPSFLEDWKMLWSCNSGAPQLVVAGGGTNSNINLGVITPPATTLTAVNLTGIAYAGGSGWAQDISDIIIDPVTNDMYTIYGSLFGTPSLSNKIYKNTSPYSGASVAWSISSGYTVIQEIANRPYLVAGQIDNSSNVLAVNSSYFFYWDGKNLKAFNKSTGAGVGTPLTIAANTALMQGGIIADECNNIFVGSTNGIIKVYSFNGSVFSDAPADITVTGYTTSLVYDLALSEARRTLYASGDGFVASFNISSYGCSTNVYTLSVNSSCSNQTATATLSPAPPSTAIVTYILYIGTAQVSSNNTGVFTNLLPNTTYTLHAFVNQACSGSETVQNFVITGPTLSISQTNATCGNSNGSITASATGGAGTLTYSKDGISFQSSGSFTSLPAGIYTITVKDSIGCSTSTTVNLTNSNGPTLSLSKTNAYCGASSGSITITGGGGTSPYSYSLNNGTYRTNNVFDTLAGGTYLVTIKDNTGCINWTSITIDNIGNATVSSTTQNASCGNNNGIITINATGGVAPYQYSINGSGYQLSNDFTGLAPGYYTINIKDSNNCVTTILDTILNSSGPSIAITANPTSCTGSSGSIVINATGGTSPFQYSNNAGTSFQSSNTFSGLTVGSYSIMVRDANGCVSTSSAIIVQTLPQITDTTTSTTCNGSTGTIRAVGTGGTPPYQYSINGTTFQSGTLFTGLSTGTYTLTIRDSVGCTNTVYPVYIDNTTGLRILGTSVATNCTGSTGQIILTGTGGTAPLRYSINGATYQSSGTFTSVAAGLYTATVKDTLGCIASISIRVSSNPAPSATATPTSATCNNSTGRITVTATAGTAPFLYSKNGVLFQSSNIFTGLASGSYTITVKDANLCTTTVSVTVSNTGTGTGPTVTAVADSAECGDANGKIDANGSGGKNPKRYSIDGVNYQGSTTFNNVPPGTYTVYVMDDNGCINTCTVTVGNIAGPQVSAIDSATVCGGSTGKITLTGFGGTAPYRYSLNGGSFQTSNLFTGLSAGFYTITVRDDFNLCNNTIVVKISNSNGPGVSLSKTDATCATHNGTITANATGGSGTKTYSLDGTNYQTSNQFTGLSAGQYALYVKDSTGCTNSTTITLSDITPPTVSATHTPEKCGSVNGTITATGSLGTLPYEYSIDDTTFQSSNVFSGLAPGTYTVTLRDSNGCLAKTNITVTAVAGPQVSTAKYHPTCSNNNGYLIITASGGTMPYQFSLNGGAFQQSFLYYGLGAGTYYIRVKDSNNCLAFDTAILTNRAAPTFTVGEDTTGCLPGRASLVVTVTSGNPPFFYSIDSITYQTSNRFTCLLAGTYHVWVRDSNNCKSTGNFTITGVPLNISLISFKALEDHEVVDLDWITAWEANNDYFTIERSLDGKHWESIENIKAAGTSYGMNSYKTIDPKPYTGLSYYRLKQTDFDGSYTYSSLNKVYFGVNKEINVYPNPASKEVILELNKMVKPSISISDALGQEILIPFVIEGSKIILNTSKLNEGIYYFKVENGYKEQTGRFTIIHR